MRSFPGSRLKRLKLTLLGGLIASSWPDAIAADESDQLIFLPENPAADSSPAPGTDNPNLIFASFAGLLQQWPNTYAYSGHSIVPGIVPKGTLLYHGTNHPVPAPSKGLEWLAFEPEYSYIIHTRRLGALDLHKYAATRDLRIIYLDGQSASLGTPGFMDSQNVLINGTVPEELGDKGRYLDAAYGRARDLCKLGKQWGFEGVVRMNTCFELMWCDFTQGLEYLGSTNTTDPYDTHHGPGEFRDTLLPESSNTDSPSDSNEEILHNSTDVNNPLLPDGPQAKLQERIELLGANDSSAQVKNHDNSIKIDNPKDLMLQVIRRPRPVNSPFYLRAPQYYFRATSRQFFWPGEVRVILDPSGFVSFYDRIESLSQKRQADGTNDSPRHTHRLHGISSSDVEKIKDRLFNVLSRKNAEEWRTKSDRLDWRTSVETIVRTYSKSLIELDYLLKRGDMSAVDRAAEVRGLTYGMILPYVDFSAWNASDPAWVERNVKKCARGFTSGTYRASDLTESIQVIIGAIEGTLDRLCSTIFSIFSQTIELDIPIDSLISPDARLESDATLRASEWRQQTEELMKWLGWSTWGHCDPPCKVNEICLPPLWPIFWVEGFPEFEKFPFCKIISGKKS
ncbi:hypothetical protein PtA15_4A532 [Puccinia triticina]|uniref:Uncharacterized protein n=1 Tax=Puccinia triticina TaxID=208348 RepID=A0ABY7CFT7_9BASI|nr:uncharacterized protein PtA15_4A532 [Puccinia triticina]WAQ84081.1 hypothetical protein PtA15_4A532 [Puccinia triticina]